MKRLLPILLTLLLPAPTHGEEDGAAGKPATRRGRGAAKSAEVAKRKKAATRAMLLMYGSSGGALSSSRRHPGVRVDALRVEGPLHERWALHALTSTSRIRACAKATGGKTRRLRLRIRVAPDGDAKDIVVRGGTKADRLCVKSALVSGYGRKKRPSTIVARVRLEPTGHPAERRSSAFGATKPDRGFGAAAHGDAPRRASPRGSRVGIGRIGCIGCWAIDISVDTKGPIPKAAVRAWLKSQYFEIGLQRCLDRSHVSGKLEVDVRFRATHIGKIAALTIRGIGKRYQHLEGCLRARLLRRRLPPADSSRPTKVALTLKIRRK